MNKILGISHLIFTVNNHKEITSEYISSGFSDSKDFTFDHSEIRTPLLRRSINGLSRISYFKPTDGKSIPVELILSDNVELRPKSSYGLIDKTFKVKANSINEISHEVLGNLKTYYCPKLRSHICFQTDLIDSQYGCWLEVGNFKEHLKLFKNDFGLKCVNEKHNMAIFKSRIINQFYSSFSIILIANNSINMRYNDDLGLSTVGWITKSSLEINNPHFNTTKSFKLKLFDKELDAHFVYDNNGISHEILEI